MLSREEKEDKVSQPDSPPGQEFRVTCPVPSHMGSEKHPLEHQERGTAV